MTDNKLGDKIQGPEGFAFISDDICDCSKPEGLRRVNCALPYAKEVVEILKQAKEQLEETKK
jgi:hypothetical protein